MEVGAEIITGVGSAFATLATVIVFLFKSREKLVAEKIELEKQHSEYKSKIVWIEHDNIRLSMELEKAAGSESVDATIVVDGATGVIKHWSPGSIAMFYYTTREIINRPFFLIVPKSQREETHKIWDRFQGNGKIPERGPFDVLAYRKDGEEIPVSLTLCCWNEKGQRMVKATMRPRVEKPNLDERSDV